LYNLNLLFLIGASTFWKPWHPSNCQLGPDYPALQRAAQPPLWELRLFVRGIRQVQNEPRKLQQNSQSLVYRLMKLFATQAQCANPKLLILWCLQDYSPSQTASLSVCVCVCVIAGHEYWLVLQSAGAGAESSHKLLHAVSECFCYCLWRQNTERETKLIISVYIVHLLEFKENAKAKHIACMVAIETCQIKVDASLRSRIKCK
jgi:hypothetical protein